METAFLKDPAYAWSVVIFAAALGCGAILAMVLIARRDPAFFRGGYFKWLGVTTALAISTPMLSFLLGGISATPPKTLAEAYCLGGGIVGWRNVLVGYAIWVGVALGGVVALLLRRR